MSQLAGKTVLVTGGSRGIGAAIVRAMAKEGARIAFTYASSVQLAQQLASDIDASRQRAMFGEEPTSTTATLVLQVDNIDPVAVQAAVSTTVEHFGRLDILVNSAGIFELKSTGEFTMDDYERQITSRLRSHPTRRTDHARWRAHYQYWQQPG